MSRNNMYRRFCAMHSRCYDPKNAKYPRYGGRGIFVCERWHDFEAYYKDSISLVIWDAMLPEKDGRRLFECRVYGTPGSPTVSLDKKIARRAVKSVFKSFQKELKGMFRKKK